MAHEQRRTKEKNMEKMEKIELQFFADAGTVVLTIIYNEKP